jgi:hypothetical protein
MNSTNNNPATAAAQEYTLSLQQQQQQHPQHCGSIIEQVFRYSHLNYTMEEDRPFGHMISNMERYIQAVGMMPKTKQKKKKIVATTTTTSSNTYATTPITTNHDDDKEDNNHPQHDQPPLPPRPKHAVYVVRTEHLWEDMGDIDRSLGGNGTFGLIQGLQVTHREEENVGNSSNNATTADTTATSSSSPSQPQLPLSIDTRRRLCCFLQSEMIWYRNLLAWAENLSIQQAKETWQGALEYCGESAWDTLMEQCRAAV